MLVLRSIPIIRLAPPL
ncbi:hypothetical protein YPPY11_1882, partial [Yersinia pestis PY-11]